MPTFIICLWAIGLENVMIAKLLGFCQDMFAGDVVGLFAHLMQAKREINAGFIYILTSWITQQLIRKAYAKIISVQEIRALADESTSRQKTQ